MKKLLFSSIVVVSGLVSAALPKPTDHWRFDCDCSPQDTLPTLTSDQQPQRVAVMNERFLAGVQGAVKQCIWGLPGATGRLSSAVIVPAKTDFTFAFFAVLPDPIKRAQSMFHNPKMSLGITDSGLFTVRLGSDELTGKKAVADGRWHLLAVTRKGTTLALWVDGRLDAKRDNVRATVYDNLDTQWAMLDAANSSRTGLDEVTVWDRALDESLMCELLATAKDLSKVPSFTPEDEKCAADAHAAANPPFAEPGDYTPLRILSTGLRPFAEQHDVNAVATPWFDPAGRDLVCKGSIFASAPLVYRFLRLEKGVPVYAQGVPWKGPDPFSAVPWRGRAGEVAWVTPLSRAGKVNSLLIRRGNPKTGEFDAGSVVKQVNGGAFPYSGGHLTFSDIDGDGTDDLVVVKNVVKKDFNGSFPWPQGKSPWTEIETPYSGKGRGYDIFNRWLGEETVSEIHWAKGTIGADGLPRFAPSRPVLMDVPDFPGVRKHLTWKCYLGVSGAAAIDTSVGRQLVLFGDMMRIVALPLRTVGEDASCGEARPLLASGYDAPHGYWIHRLTPIDFDGDGRKELMLDGNPGTVAILKGDKPGEWISNRAWVQGGSICGETLSSSARIDWDGDGYKDIILTDASGWFTFWGGTKDPLVYKEPRPFTVEGKPLCLKGGRSGSLQGEVECVWGYVKVIAGQWGSESVLITVDIRGDLLLHRRASKDDPLALRKAQPFTHPDGRPFKVAWRSRPDFVRPGFAGVPRRSLVIQDVDGDLSVAVPKGDGSLVIEETRKLHYASGETIRLCGINGLFGRGHVAVVDWDGDDDDDLIIGSNGSCQKYFTYDRPIRPQSSSFLLRNVGSEANPQYAQVECLTLRNSGKRLIFGWHNATPTITDLDGDGGNDLLVSAENGKVYCFHREDIACDATVVAGLKVDHLERPSNVGARPTFSWRMESDRKGARQLAYELCVRQGGSVVWNSGEVASSNSANIAYSGKNLESAMRYTWSVRVKDDRGFWSIPARSCFTTGLLLDSDMDGSQWIVPDALSATNGETAVFRKVLVNAAQVDDAWCAIAAAGVFTAYVNGEEIAPLDVLKPGYVHPLKVRQLCTYPLPSAFDRRAGATNVFSLVLTPSWSRDRIARRDFGGNNSPELRRAALRAQIILRHANGRVVRVGTSPDWQAAVGVSLVVSAGIYEGESVDARIDENWKTDKHANSWPPARQTDFAGLIRPFLGPPIRLREQPLLPISGSVLKGVRGATAESFGTAIAVRRFVDGERMALSPGEQLVVDFGQNCSAVPEVVLEGERGTRVTLEHAEMLNEGGGLKSRGNDGPAGTPYRANLRSCAGRATYVCRGGKEEHYRPQYTFFGYRYLGIRADRPVVIHRVRSCVVSSVADDQNTISFKTDNARLNRLFENCRWGMLSNYISVPTDCPQRDERIGWSGDTQAFAPAAMFLADSYSFLSKWLTDMRDAQRQDGCYAQVAPGSWVRGAVTGWTDAGVLVPSFLWHHFGDLSVVRENWSAMCAYRDYLAKEGWKDVQPYGDWLSYEYGPDMPWLSHERFKLQLPRKSVLNFSYRIRVGRLLAEMGEAIGDHVQAAKSREFAESELAKFRATCLNADGTLKDECGGQCSMLHVLYLGMLPNEAAIEKTRAELKKNFAEHGNCLQTGFLGTAVLMDGITEGLRDGELAYTLLLQDKNPSWLYSVDQGATTIWERWNSYTREKGFGPVEMNSFNHYAYGAVAGWMVRTMAGIRADPDHPGFQKFILAPLPDKRIGWVKASYDSPFGRIESNWHFDAQNRWNWQFAVPPNTTATVILPGKKPAVYGPGRHSLAN